SFVSSYESRTGPGFHGKSGFVASWRSSSPRSGAIRVTSSPFKTFAEVEEACNVMLGYVKPSGDSTAARKTDDWGLTGLAQKLRSPTRGKDVRVRSVQRIKGLKSLTPAHIREIRTRRQAQKP